MLNRSFTPSPPACKVSPSHFHFICWRHMGALPPHVGPGWRHRRHMGALPPHVGPGWRDRGICGCISCSSPFNSWLPRSTRGDGVVEPVVAGWNLLPAMAKKSSSSNGEKVVQPKCCRKGQTNCQGTSPKVRMERLNVKIDGLTIDNAVLQENYDRATRQLTRVLAERDSARTQLKISENTSAHRLLLIKNEVPDFSRSFLKGRYDCYTASL